jgi:ribosomal-protein-alanine N-acetyltransferase
VLPEIVMAKSKILKADRLELKPFAEEFLTNRYVGWLNDKVTTRYSEQRHRLHTIESCRAYADSFAGAPSYFWAIVARDPALDHIGNMTATVDAANRVTELAIMIGEINSRGHGYGFEAWMCACRFLLGECGMRKVSAGTMAVNIPMLRIMKSAGMIEEGRRSRQFLFEGTEVDAILMALFAR